MKEGDSYLDIVWRQFKKNRSALFCFVVLRPADAAGDFRSAAGLQRSVCVPRWPADDLSLVQPRSFIRRKRSISCSTWR